MELTPKIIDSFISSFKHQNILFDFLYGYLKIPKKDIIKIEETTNSKISETLLSRFNNLSGASFSWEYNNDIVSFYQGRMLLLSFGDMVKGNAFSGRKRKKGELHKGLLWKEGNVFTEEIKKLENEYFILDVISGISHTYAVVKFENNTSRVSLIKYPLRIYPLTLNMEDYLKYSIIYKGMFLWQELFIDREIADKELLIELDNERHSCFLPEDIINDNIFSVLKPLITEKYKENIQILNQCNILNYRNKLLFSLNNLKMKMHSEDDKLNINNEKEFNLQSLSKTSLNPLFVQAVEYELKKRIPDNILAFYFQIDGLDINWEITTTSINSYKPFADFKILNFYSVFGINNIFERGGREDYYQSLFEENNFKDEKEFLFSKSCRLIYFSEFTKVFINIDESDFPLYMLIEGVFYPVNLNFDEFMSTLFDVLGLEYWERFITKREVLDDEELAKSAPFNPFLDFLFPDVNKDLFRRVITNVEKE